MPQYSLLGVLLALLLCGTAQAAVLETNEWNNKTQTGWQYSSGTNGDGAVIDTAPAGGAAPSGGSAMKFVYDAGTYAQSIGGGRAEFTNLTGSEIYVGHWAKWSPNYTWNAVATKLDYIKTAANCTSIAQLCYTTLRTRENGAGLALDVGIDTPHTRYNNVGGTFNFPRGQWVWVEWRVKLNTLGSANGILQVWINDALKVDYANVQFMSVATTWKYLQHSPEWGGIGGTIPSTQYYWVDHTVISTTRIGMPGAPPSGDTTPPTIPSALSIR